MSSLSYRSAIPASFARTLTIGALMGATILATPLASAYAQSAAAAPATTAATADEKAETVEMRITSLHTALAITPAEEAKWTDVAQAMRDNAAAMQKLAAETTAMAPADKTAVAELKTYDQFAEAHVAGLKSLISSFESLYDSMPDPQKKVADAVFESNRRENAAAHS